MTIFLIILVVGIIPIITITSWKPFELYCLPRIELENSDEQLPAWCLDSIPNVYNYIQVVYWKVGWLGFLDRPWYLMATSLFTNQLFFYILYRCIRGFGPVSFFTLGVFNPGEKDNQTSIFNNRNMLPHAYIFLVNMTVVLLLANSEINSRVASTCPFYFYAFSQLILECHKDLKNSQQQKAVSLYQHVLIAISLWYNQVIMMLNLLLFTVEIGFV